MFQTTATILVEKKMFLSHSQMFIIEVTREQGPVAREEIKNLRGHFEIFWKLFCRRCPQFVNNSGRLVRRQLELTVCVEQQLFYPRKLVDDVMRSG